MKKILAFICIFLLVSLNAYGGFWMVIEQDVAGGGGNAISFVATNGVTTATTTDTTSLVLSVPSGCSDGNIMYAAINTDVSIGAISEPYEITGWTRAGTSSESSSSWTSLFYRVAASEPASYTFTRYEGPAADFNGVMACFSKTDGTWDAIQSTNNSNAQGASSLTSGSVTATDGSFHIVAFGTDDGGTVGTVPDMTNAGYQEGAGSSGVGLWYESVTTGSAITRTWTPSITGDLSSVSTVLEAE